MNKTSAASRWVDQATMNKAIGQVIHDNIEEIRIATKGGNEWTAQNRPVGYTTGSGWVKRVYKNPSNQVLERGVFWDDDLKGMTIVIRPRKNHLRTAEDPEGWFVYTAYPDRVINPTSVEITRPAGFDAGALYEVTYTARDPAVLGMGFAAVRDVASFLRHEQSAANPLLS